jgi:SAM-dependent methyltransferase|tara:strand:+ start:74 stop:925 length:852 start_codon:yes stop_codon:yes gene_type:complete
MVKLELRYMGRDYVEKRLRELLDLIRDRNYDMKREYGWYPIEYIKGRFRYVEEGNKALIAGLKANLGDDWDGSMADFCCGSGSLTLKIADDYPLSNIHGFDTGKKFIRLAKFASKNNPKVNFSLKDVYNLEDNIFDVVTFNNACGSLSDKIIQYGVENKAQIIVGKFCCHEEISREVSQSKDWIENVVLKLFWWYNDWVRDRGETNYISPRDDVNRDLLSEFGKKELGMTDDELEKIARTTVNSLLGNAIIDFNRMMKLIERGYEVWYDSKQSLVVARRKDVI